ncbi:Uncharacterised protein [Segatella oris]|uniref:Uncharacterized protein n=1 Tax=Segatella oris TaxID=28135 RepID=A0A448L9Q5_9BACT|nr:Uncharacterised protein [Segatella oris]
MAFLSLRTRTKNKNKNDGKKQKKGSRRRRSVLCVVFFTVAPQPSSLRLASLRSAFCRYVLFPDLVNPVFLS